MSLLYKSCKMLLFVTVSSVVELAMRGAAFFGARRRLAFVHSDTA